MSFDKIISEPYTELESQCILRLPEEPASKLREALQTGNSLKDRLSIKLDNDMRIGEVQFDHYTMRAKVVDLPCIIESMKTIDNKTFYKTADISQMMICEENGKYGEHSDEEDKSKTKKKDPTKVDKKYLHPHGITPPMKNVRYRRFRKVLRKKHVETPEVEKEVKRLLRGDYEAISVRWELVKEGSEKPKMKGASLKAEPSTNAEDSTGFLDDTRPSVDYAEHDIFGEALSDSDDDDLSHGLMDEDSSRISLEDSKFSDSIQGSYDGSSSSKLVTEFSKDMFTDDNVYEMKRVIKSEVIKDEVEDEDLKDHYNVKNDANISKQFKIEPDAEDNFVANQGTIRAKLDALQVEISDLKTRIHQQEIEIASIENHALKQRFQDILDELLSVQLQKEQQCQKLSALLEGGI